LSTLEGNENLANGTKLASFSTVDEDVNDTFKYAFATDLGCELTQLYIALNELRVRKPLNYEKTPTIKVCVVATDSGGKTVKGIYTFKINNVAEAPSQITLTAQSVDELSNSGKVIGAIGSVDEDLNDTFTYTLVKSTDGPDDGSFQIVGNSLRTLASFDFEQRSLYRINIRSTDASGMSREQRFEIKINDMNEAPTNLVVSSLSVYENSTANSVVATLSAVDPDRNDKFTYSLVNGSGSTHNASFAISGNQLKVAAAINYESIQLLSIRLKCSDRNGLSYEKSFNLTVVDMNDAPTDVALSNTVITNQSAAHTFVGSLTVTDQDTSNKNYQFQLVKGSGSTDNSKFYLIDNKLYTKFVAKKTTQSQYAIRLRVKDGALLFDKAFILQVN
jgi:hypothetical protein